MNSDLLKNVLIALLGTTVLVMFVVNRSEKAKFQAETANLQAQVQPPQSSAEQNRMETLAEPMEVDRLRATIQVLQEEVLRLQSQLRAIGQVATKTPPGATSPDVPIIPGGEESTAAAKGFSGIMKGAMEQHFMGRFERMKAKLNLAPDQEAAIHKILQSQAEMQSGVAQKVFSGKLSQEEMMSMQKSASNPEEQIKALLNPDQLSAYQDLNREESVSNARLMANSEVLQMQNVLGLSQDQQDRVYEALYQQTMDNLSGKLTGNLPKGGDVGAMMQMQLDQKVKALEGVLTPDQMQKYRQMQEKQLEMMKALMPKKAGAAAAVPSN